MTEPHDLQPELQPLKRATYGELARLFLRLSLLAFGGPVAHIAMAQDEIVERRRWLTKAHYLDLIAATNLIPGPNSTEVMIHVGYVMRGIPGAILSGACFIIPAFLITLVLAAFYVTSGTIPQVEAIFWGLKPVIVAIIAVAGYRLIPDALKNRSLQILFILAIGALILLDLHEVIAMLGAGVIYALWIRGGAGMMNAAALFVGDVGTRFLFRNSALSVQNSLSLIQAANGIPVSLWELFWYFLRIGAVLFGSGYVLIAYIQQDLVNTFGWLTSQQLLDAVAIGQFTPGPVSTTAAVVGYIVSGLAGAVVATVGIFLPSFVLVILSAPLIPKMRRSKFMGAFLDGVNAGVLAAITVTVIDLARAALIPLGEGIEAGAGVSVIALILFAVAMIAQIRFKINATWLVVVGGIVGFLVGAAA